MPPEIHPATQTILRYFEYEHLPPYLQAVSRGFHDLAHDLVANPDVDGPELTVGLRKLLESKDCAVRAALPVKPTPATTYFKGGARPAGVVTES